MLSCLMLSFVEMPQASHNVSPGESLNEGTHNESLSFLRFVNRVFWSGHGFVL